MQDNDMARALFAKLIFFRQILIWIVDSMLVTLLLAMIIIAALQIIARNFFDAGIVWADPTLRALVLWVALLGAVVASRNDKHITIDIFSRYLSERLRQVVMVITRLFTAAISALLAYFSYDFVLMEYEAQTEAFGAVKSWMLQSILPVAFGLIATRYVAHTSIHAYHLFTGKPSS